MTPDHARGLLFAQNVAILQQVVEPIWRMPEGREATLTRMRGALVATMNQDHGIGIDPSSYTLAVSPMSESTDTRTITMRWEPNPRLGCLFITLDGYVVERAVLRAPAVLLMAQPATEWLRDPDPKIVNLLVPVRTFALLGKTKTDRWLYEERKTS